MEIDSDAIYDSLSPMEQDLFDADQAAMGLTRAEFIAVLIREQLEFMASSGDLPGPRSQGVH